MRQEVVRNARTVVLDAEFERQRHARLAGPGSDSRTPGRNAVVSWISPSLAPSPIASAAFFTRLRNTWIELVAIGQHRRQRRVVFLDELDVAREARLREPLHVVEHDDGC